LENKIKHLNRVLRAIRKVNQLITKEKDRDRLIKGASENLTETRGYFNAWIALLDDSGKYITSAESGFGKEFLLMIELMKSGKITACGKKALKKLDVIITENPQNECKDCPLSVDYADRAGISLRLEYEGKIYGIISVSIPKKFVKDKEEHSLFKEVAEDIAFALHNIEVETERKQTEEELNKANRLYATLSQVNQTIIREWDKQKLFQEICDIAIKFGKFRLAWIGLVDEENKLVKPVAFSGKGSDYLNFIKISFSDFLTGKGPSGRAIHEVKCGVFNDLENNPAFAPWRKQALEKGYRSSAAFPIRLNNKIIGAFNVYAVETHFFDEDEINLLEEAFMDISFALEKFEEEENRKKAEEQIKKDLEEKNILLQEVHHRVKNNMQIVSSLLKLQSSHIKDKRALELFQNSQDRVKTMSLIHDALYRSKDLASIDFADYVRKLTTQIFISYGANSNFIKLKIDIKDILLDISTSIPCGLIINELVSNSLKYAFPKGKGEIIISFTYKDQVNTLCVKDNGIGISGKINLEDSPTLGLKLVNSLTKQLDGTLKLEKVKGASFKITFKKIELKTYGKV
jgi:two-component sensor histidine kinase